MSGQYAKNTEVPVDRSLAEIRRTIYRYGATSFTTHEENGLALIGFAMNGRQVRFLLKLPDPNDREFTRTPTTGRPRTAAMAAAEYEKAVKRVYRVFTVATLAMLEMVASGVVAFEELFLPFTVLPGGMTVSETVGPGVAEAYATRQVPALLPDYRRAITAGGSQ